MGKTGHLTCIELKEIVDGVSFPDRKVDCFVETGTYMGQSTLSASKVFDTVHTIEIVEDLQIKARNKCKDADNIFFHLGDTVQLLPAIVNGLADEQKGVLWFLDAHQSGADTSNNGEWVPLLKELNIILDGLNRKAVNIFVIDDVRLFSKHWDWEGISLGSIKKCFENHNIRTQSELLKNDRFIIYT